MKQLLSVIVPCYNEEEALPYFYKELTYVFEEIKRQYEINTEVLFVNDGSKDKTLELLHSYAEIDMQVRYISFSRNFGKEAAIYAGFCYSKGDYIAIMDADMQDPPSLLSEMYSCIVNERYERVATRRINREGEPPFRSFCARCFYKIINKISDTDIMDGARDFQLMTRKVVNAILELSEYNRFSKGIFGWVGFETKWIPYKNIERIAGNTKWSFWKLFLYSLEGIIAFSTAPLVLSSLFGIFLCFIALIMIIVIILRTIVFGDPVSGWPSLVCIIIFIGGIQLFCTGILGQYLSKVYLETKKRPIFIIDEMDEHGTKEEKLF